MVLKKIWLNNLNCYKKFMPRLNTQKRHKLNKALNRVEKVVIMDTRNSLEQQKKWKAKLAENRKNR